MYFVAAEQVRDLQCMCETIAFNLFQNVSFTIWQVVFFQYVCQKNCGVETTDGRGGDTLFLCKICSEAREVVSVYCPLA